MSKTSTSLFVQVRYKCKRCLKCLPPKVVYTAFDRNDYVSRSFMTLSYCSFIAL